MPGDNVVLYRFELTYEGKVLDVFNFIVNPQSASYDGKYRDYIHKTFGGTRVDIQGMDNQTIKLGGTFTGSKPRTGWTRSGGSMTAVDALKYFRDNIWRYPENPKYGVQWPFIQVKLYDTDLNEPLFVHINSFSYNRSSGKAFWWDWSLQLTVIGKVSTPSVDIFKGKLAKYKDFLQGVVHLGETIQNGVNAALETVRPYLDSTLGIVDDTLRTMTSFVSSIDATVHTLLTVPGDVVDRLSATAKTFRDLGDSIAGFVATDIGLVGEYKEYLQNQWTAVAEACISTAKTFEYAVSKENLRRIYSHAFVNPKKDVKGGTPPSGFGRGASYNEAPSSSAVGPEAEDGIQTAVGSQFLFDHTEELSIGSDTTVSDISVRYYGDESMVPVLLELNGLKSSFLPAGTLIQIPVMADLKTIPGNLVLSRENDNFGKDVMLDENGNIKASSGLDLLTVGGIANIAHIIQNIYSIDTGSYLSDRSFGLDKDSLIGAAGTATFTQLVGMKVREALLKDPRIADFTNFAYSNEGDRLDISGTIVLHNGLTQDVRLSA